MPNSILRLLVIGAISLRTLVELFAAKAVPPSLAAAHNVLPSAIGTAVNACTLGMAVAGAELAPFISTDFLVS